MLRFSRPFHGHFHDRMGGFRRPKLGGNAPISPCAKYELDDKFVKCDEKKKTFTRMAILHYEKTIDITKNLAVSDALLWKNAIWEYEKEVRVIDYDPDGKDEFREQDAPPLKAIYLGVKCSDKDRHDMQLALRRQSVELYQMHIDSNDICSLSAERIG